MLDLTLKLIQLAPWVISGASLICALTPTPADLTKCLQKFIG